MSQKWMNKQMNEWMYPRKLNEQTNEWMLKLFKYSVSDNTCLRTDSWKIDWI